MEIFNLIFFGPRYLAEVHPLACAALGALLIGVQAALVLRAGARFDTGFFRLAPTFAGLLWLIYGLYEPQVRAAFPNAGVRIDLLVLVPILYVFSGVALWSIASQWRSRRLPERPAPPASEVDDPPK